MRTILIVIFSMLSISIFSQRSLEIFSKLDEAKFKIYINGKIQSEERKKKFLLSDIDTNVYTIKINFEEKGVADIDEEIRFLPKEKKVYEIKKKSTVGQGFAKVGRGIGKFLKIGKHDKEEVLIDKYILKDVTKSDFFNN